MQLQGNNDHSFFLIGSCSSFLWFCFLFRKVEDWLDYARHTDTVNAYNCPWKNAIQIPAGILTSVMFNSERPKYMNFGAIGFVMGHEITHGFDSTGRHYNEDGNLEEWWHKETAKM